MSANPLYLGYLYQADWLEQVYAKLTEDELAQAQQASVRA